VAKRKKRKLTRKQRLAGFGGKRAQSAARSSGSRGRGKASSKRRTTKGRKVSKKKKTASSGGVPTSVKLAIIAALTIVLAIAGDKVNDWVQAHGGWSVVYAAWKTGGPEGLISLAAAGKVVTNANLPLSPSVMPQPGLLDRATGSLGGLIGGGQAAIDAYIRSQKAALDKSTRPPPDFGPYVPDPIELPGGGFVTPTLEEIAMGRAYDIRESEDIYTTNEYGQVINKLTGMEV